MAEQYAILVNAEPLARLLRQADPGGYLSNELGVAWADDGSGVARRLVSTVPAANTMPAGTGAVRDA